LDFVCQRGRNGFASFWKLDPKKGEPVQVTNIGQRAVDETFVPRRIEDALVSGWPLVSLRFQERRARTNLGLHFAVNGDLVSASKLADGLEPTWTEEGKAFVYSKRVNDHTESAVATMP